ncbi:MAG: hypothetical protein M0R49_02345 [Limnochordia bacterium]|jgi:hypothetical protein|nr:hypothetical protein [Limnochordia bacterium]
MKGFFPWIVVTVVFVFSICAAASPAIPEDFFTLPEDAELLDVRDNPANGGLEIAFVSDLDLEKLHELYAEALKEADDLSITAIPGGYMISATLAGVDYTLMLSEDAMDATIHAGKTSVYVVLNGLEGRTVPKPEESAEQGLPWPASDLPGLPELKGHIEKILRADGSVFLELTVESSEVVMSYIEDLREAGFSFDSEPGLRDGYVEFFAFHGNSVLGFGYGEDDNFIAMEYMK